MICTTPWKITVRFVRCFNHRRLTFVTGISASMTRATPLSTRLFSNICALIYK